MENYLQKYYDDFYNHQRTCKEWKCIDVKGESIPWITYAALFQLEQYDFSNCRIFEWGGGHSTAYWSPRCAHITTVEHDPEWFEFVQSQNLPNAALNHVELADYAGFIDRTDARYELIVIDGYIHEKMRFHCAKNAVKHLQEGGLILLDNSDWLPNTCAFLREQGFDQFDFNSLGPINKYAWCTSLFHKGAVQITRKAVSPGFVPGGLDNERD